MIRCRDRVLPDQVLGRHLTAHIAAFRPHIAVRQLKPGARKRVGEFVEIFVEPAGDFQIGRIRAQRDVGRCHHWCMTPLRVMCIRHEITR